MINQPPLNRAKRVTVKRVGYDHHASSSSDSSKGDMFMIHNVAGVKHPVASVKLNETEIKFIVDSG